jgi:hypothetical protein
MEGIAARPENGLEDSSADPEGRLWKVFVSSTSTGLAGFRDVARDVISGFRFGGMKCFEPVMMEDWGAQPTTARELCAAKIRPCALMVGIIGIRYGAHPPEDQTSYTELEYHTAVKQGVSRLMFVLDRDLAAKLEGVAPQGKDRADRQERFRERVETEQVVEMDVASAANFQLQLGTALDTWVRDYSFKRALVDHDVEFKAVRERLLGLSEWTGGAALIFGEPGTGKTTMFDALLNDTLLRRSFVHPIPPVTIRLAEGTDKLEQQRATAQSALDDFAARQKRQGAALPAVLIALHLEPDSVTGRDADPGTLGILHKLFSWDVPRAVVLAETNDRSVKERLERELSWEPGTVTTLRDYVLVADALEQMRREAPDVGEWPEPDTRILVEALGMRPISLHAAATHIAAEAENSPYMVADVIREQLEAIAHEKTDEGKYGALVRNSIDRLSPAAKELLAVMTVLHPKPTLFPDEMAVALDLLLERDKAISIAAATAEDRHELGADEQRHLRNGYKLVAELVGRGLLERVPRTAASQDGGAELVTLHPANVRVIRDYLHPDRDKQAEGHVRAEAFYRARVGEAISGSFDSHFRMESPEWWDDVEEWIYHLGHTTPGQAGTSFAALFMDAYWWWDLYVRFDLSDKLLDYGQRPRVQAVSTEMPEITRLLAKFRETYPREHESTREQILAEAGEHPALTGRFPEIARGGVTVIPVLQELCRRLGITELDVLFADQPPGLSGPAAALFPEAPEAAGQTRLHLLGLVCLFLAEGHRFRAFLDPAGRALETAAACYQTAESCFEAEDSAWDLAWTRYHHGEVVSGLRGDPGPLWDAAADVADDESDTELLGNVERARADHLRARGNLEEALAHYGRAVFYGLTQQVTSNLDAGADPYTQAFYREMRLHAAKVLAEPVLGSAGSAGIEAGLRGFVAGRGRRQRAEGRRRLDVMLAQWGGHWEPEPGPLNRAFRALGSAGRQTAEGVEAMEQSFDALADAAFFDGPGDAVLGEPDSKYYRKVSDLIETVGKQPWVRGLGRWNSHREQTREHEAR